MAGIAVERVLPNHHTSKLPSFLERKGLPKKTPYQTTTHPKNTRFLRGGVQGEGVGNIGED